MNNSVRSRKIIGILVIVILVFTACTVNVYAANTNDSFKTVLSVDKSQAKRGDNITITIAISDIAIESGEKGIGAYTAGLDFDSSVFEYSSADGTDKWEAPMYQDSLIAGNTNDGEVVKTAQNIGTITFKVKDNAKLGETTIKLINFSGSTAETDVTAEDTSVKVTIEDKDGNSGNGTGSGTQNGEENGNENGNGNGTQNGGSSSGTQNGSGSGTLNGGANGSGNGSSNSQNGGNAGSGNKISVGNNNGNGVSSTKQGILPQTGDVNRAKYMLISISILVAVILFVRIKLLKYDIQVNKK